MDSCLRTFKSRLFANYGLPEMILSIDVFWSFRSPYSYLATARLVRLREKYDLTIEARPVLPLAVRTPEFFERANPLFVSYLLRDMVRVAERLNIPLSYPNPDPVVFDMANGRYPEEQPYIHRLTRLGAAAAERGDGLAFVDEVSQVIWGGTQDWHLGTHLAEAAERAGFNLLELDAAIESEPERFVNGIEENQQALEAAGHWGVPTCVFKGEPFFGQDRIVDLVWRLEQNGLQERGG